MNSHLNQFIEQKIPVDPNELATALHQMINDQCLGFFLEARTGSGVTGFADVSLAWMLEHGGRSAWLDEPYVLPEYRDRGRVATYWTRFLVKQYRRAACNRS